MPSLRETGFIDGTKEPYLWICSSCEAAFALERMRPASVSELHKIDAEFRKHCAEKHPRDAVIGLQIANPKEDASQTAARIVREATKDR
jgi:hypothetical protein